MAVTSAALANIEIARLRKTRAVVSRRAPHSDRLASTTGQHDIFVRDYRRHPENEGLNDAQSDNVQPGHWAIYEPAINGPGVYSRSDLIWA